MQTAFVILAAYLLGSVPFAVISSRLFGLADPRSYGSGNPGATNVLRSGNKKAALLTLLLTADPSWLGNSFNTEHLAILREGLRRSGLL